MLGLHTGILLHDSSLNSPATPRPVAGSGPPILPSGSWELSTDLSSGYRNQSTNFPEDSEEMSTNLTSFTRIRPPIYALLRRQKRYLIDSLIVRNWWTSADMRPASSVGHMWVFGEDDILEKYPRITVEVRTRAIQSRSHIPSALDVLVRHP